MGQRRGAYAPEFRQQMVKLVKAGRKPSELAKELGCHDTSISGWVRQANADELGGGIFTWIESWYNPLRRHSGLGQLSPNAFERSLQSHKADIDIIEAEDLVPEGQTVR